MSPRPGLVAIRVGWGLAKVFHLCFEQLSLKFDPALPVFSHIGAGPQGFV